jgi:hypothetical protein
MTWAALFDQAETYDVDLTEIREALATHREEQTE